MNIYWPVALIVLSNVAYHICAKSTPESVHPMATLTVTYTVGAVLSALMYFLLNRGGNLIEEYRHINWTTWVLGIAIVGLEVGSMEMYRVGWEISVGQLVQSALLAVCLLVVGLIFYKEQLSWTKMAGIVICLVGLYVINKG